MNQPMADAAPELQKCIDSGASTIELVPGNYYVSTTLHIRNQTGLTVRTQGVSSGTCLKDGSSPVCAVLVGAPKFKSGPLLAVDDSKNLELSRIALDGNITQRRKTLGNSWQREAFNSTVHGCEGCRFIGFASVNAVGGTGMEYVGDNAVFDRVLFRNNGWGINQYPKGGAWSDGLTLLSSAGARITDSDFLDNSDIDLILGGAAGAVVENNRIGNSVNFAFAALMLDNFNNTQNGKYVGAMIQDNVIDCGDTAMCGIGIDLGPRLWYPSARIVGGTVTRNVVRNSRQGVGIYGADGISLRGNRIEPRASYALPGGKCRTSVLDVIDGVRLDLDPSLKPTSGNLAGCDVRDFVRMTPQP